MSTDKEGKVKRPAFQFYPGDWMRSTDLRSCSVGARGLWIDMICLMHEGTPYGHLKVNQKVIHAPNLARIVGATIDEVEGWLEELEAAGVCSRDEDGCYLSRRMIRDESIRQVRAAAGKLGGNPNLKKPKEVAGKVGERLTNEVKQNPTPSSAVALASASASAVAVAPTEKSKEQKPSLELALDRPDAGGKPPKTDKADTALQAACRSTWSAYCGAYSMRYGAEPVRNAKVNSQIKQLVQALGHEEAPQVAAYFLTINDQFFVKRCHPLDILLTQCGAIRTQWVTGRQITSTKAQQIDRSATNAGNVDEAVELAIRMRNRRETGNAG